MITKIKEFVKEHFSNIMLFIIIVLLILLSFALGYIVAKNTLKEPIIIENSN
jgi:hypothetical protein